VTLVCAQSEHKAAQAVVLSAVNNKKEKLEGEI
jgi:hypothetical protein